MRQRLLGYRPGLDLLRAIAVLGVLYSHCWDEHSAWGQLGVRLFFVLSGFLITDILLEVREEFEKRPAARFTLLRNFIIRRSLRIWPAYFLVLGVALLLNFQGVRAVAGWHLLFLSNVLFSLRNEHLPWVMAAWWSLSVEEQFYLFWPSLVCFAPRRWLPWLIVSVIYLGVVWQLSMAYFSIQALGAYYLPPAAFEALGAGAGLALLRRLQGSIPSAIEYVGWLVMPLVIFLTTVGWTDWTWATLNVLPMISLVLFGLRTNVGLQVRWFSLPRRFLLWIGRVSYGVYLYHLFIFAMLYKSSLGVPQLEHRGPVLFSSVTLITILVASTSWVLVEGPLNALKRYFPYRDNTSELRRLRAA